MNHSLGLLIGGILPALAFGIGAIFQKQGNDIGISQGHYLLFFSLGMLIASGIAFIAFQNSSLFSLKAGLFASAHGLAFGAGFVFLALGLTVFALPVSQLVPLANMSTLVAVVLGLIIFGEYTKLNMLYLLGGSALIIVGGILVSKA